jgi:hypothetical protein
MTLEAVIPSRRAVLLALALVAVALCLVLLRPAESEAVPCGFEWRYYSDGTYTQLVGREGNLPHECGCTTYSWGTITLYKKGADSLCW